MEQNRHHVTLRGKVIDTSYLRLQTHTQNMYYLLLFQCNSGWMNMPQYHITLCCHLVSI